MAATQDLENAANNTPILCKRCNTSVATQNARQDPVCENCFISFVTTKAVKRMESYKARGKAPKDIKRLLLPVSFGPSSTSLLYVLDQQLQGQLQRMGRTSYELHVVHVDLSTQELHDSHDAVLRMNKIREQFPRHTYSTVGIEESLNLPSINWSSLGLPQPSVDSKALKSSFEAMLSALPSPTARSDITTTLLTRLLVNQAEIQNCTSILFGDSTTRLAERTLTSTAAGRGFSLPWLVSDGPSPHSLTNQDSSSNTPTPPINFQYPLRDILKKEIITLTTLLNKSTPSLKEIIIYDKSMKHISASDKATTINDLMVQYFESVEENYPSIVANVVRTSSKLVAPSNENGKKECGLCGFPVAEGTDGIFGWGGDQNDDRAAGLNTDSGSGEEILCYGCSRSVHG